MHDVRNKKFHYFSKRLGRGIGMLAKLYGARRSLCLQTFARVCVCVCALRVSEN